MDNDNRTTEPPQKVDLASLYPTPKTYDELEQRNQARLERMVKRQPKHIAVRVAFELSVLFLFLYFYILIVPSLVRGNVIAGTFVAFFLGLLFAWLVYSEYQRLGRRFDIKGGSPASFLLTYCLPAFLLLSACLPVAGRPAPSAEMVASMAAVHAVFVLALVSIMLSDHMASKAKVVFSIVAMFAAGALAAIGLVQGG